MNSARRFLHAAARRLLPVLLLSPAVLRAANYTVTSFADSGAGSLRNAIAAANANPGDDTISLTGLAGTITLAAASGPLTITDTVTITGSGARLLAVTGNQAVSVLHITGDPFNPVRARISGLTLRDGRAPVSGSLTASGGGIVVNGNGLLEMYDCTLSGHRALAPAASGVGANGLSARGAAAFIAGDAIFYRCTFSGNIATGSAGIPDAGAFARGGAGGAAQGSAIFVGAAGTLTADTCTFYGNTATGGAGANAHFGGNGGAASGAAIFAQHNTTVTACTISGNSGQGGTGGDGSGNINDGAAGAGTGGLFQTGGGTHTVRSTICAGNTGNGGGAGDVSGTFTSGGFNLIGASFASHGFLNSNDQTGTPAALLAPGLGALQNNGGPANTMLPLAGSPALDKGRSFPVPIQDCSTLFGCFAIVPLADQRGRTRVADDQYLSNAGLGDGTDTGAVEVDPIQSGPVFWVTTLDDHNDGTCSYGDGTLREAIAAANSAAGQNTIVISAAAAQGGGITLEPASGPLSINDSTTVFGPGARLFFVSGGGLMRVFHFTGGISLVSGLTIASGSVNGGGNGAEGAGLINSGTLTLSECTLTGHETMGGTGTGAGAAGGGASGGAIANDGTLFLDRCTLLHNRATGGDGISHSGPAGRGGEGGHGRGGAVHNYASGQFTAINCTFGHNTGTGGNGGNGPNFGGGNGGDGAGAIFNLGTMTLSACTFSRNAGTGGSGGQGNVVVNNGAAGAGSGAMHSAGGTGTVRNTLSAGNTGTAGPDARGAFASGGYNLIGISNGSSGFNAATDQSGTFALPLDARLGPLWDNGGPTDTFALLTGSPAFDRGKAFGPVTDQRGLSRPRDLLSQSNAAGGDGSDIGALEMRPPGTSRPVLTFLSGSPVRNLLLEALPAARYQLQMNSDLGPVWNNLGTIVTADDVGEAVFTDSTPPAVRRFYRAVPAP